MAEQPALLAVDIRVQDIPNALESWRAEQVASGNTDLRRKYEKRLDSEILQWIQRTIHPFLAVDKDMFQSYHACLFREGRDPFAALTPQKAGSIAQWAANIRTIKPPSRGITPF